MNWSTSFDDFMVCIFEILFHIFRTRFATYGVYTSKAQSVSSTLSTARTDNGSPKRKMNSWNYWRRRISPTRTFWSSPTNRTAPERSLLMTLKADSVCRNWNPTNGSSSRQWPQRVMDSFRGWTGSRTRSIAVVSSIVRCSSKGTHCGLGCNFLRVVLRCFVLFSVELLSVLPLRNCLFLILII